MDERRREGAGQLVAIGVPYSTAEDLVDLLDEDCFEKVPGLTSRAAGSGGLMVPGIRWVIKKDDLDLIDCASKGFIAAAGAYAATSGSAAVTAISGGIATVFKICRQIRRKGVVLDPLQYKVLAKLKLVGPCKVDQLVAALNEDLPQEDKPWQPASVLQELARLAKTRLSDGNIARLADEDGEGLWSIVGV